MLFMKYYKIFIAKQSFEFHSYRHEAAILAALVPGVNIIRMLLLGFGILKDEATVKSMSRHGDYRLTDL